MKREEKLKFIENKKKKKQKFAKQIFFWLSLSSLSIGVYFTGKNIYDFYLKNEQWRKADKTPLAQFEPYMLYLDDKEKNSLSQYISTYNKLFDTELNEFKVNSQEEIDKLNSFYDNSSDTLKNHLSEKHNQLNKLWNIKVNYDKIISNDTVLVNITPNKIQEFIDNHWNNLIIFLDNNKSNYYEHIYNKMLSVVYDTDNIAELMLIFSNTFDKTSEGLAVKPDIQSSAIIDWEYYKNSLENDWLIVTKRMSPLISKANQYLLKHDNGINKYNSLLKAQSDKISYETWISEYNTIKTQIIDLPDFTGKNKEEIYKWADENGIVLSITEKESEEEKDKILEQSPNNSRYAKIIKGGAVKIVIAIEKKEKPSSSSSSSSSSTGDKSSSENLITEPSTTTETGE